jgi:ribosomal protein L7/L12
MNKNAKRKLASLSRTIHSLNFTDLQGATLADVESLRQVEQWCAKLLAKAPTAQSFLYNDRVLDLTVEQKRELDMHRANRNKITAIKCIREWFGIGLSDAKNVCEQKLGF